MNTRTETYGYSDDQPSIDRNVLIGTGISVFLIGIGILASGNGMTFLNPAGLLIVLGGTFGATLVHFSTDDIRYAWLALQHVLFSSEAQPNDRIKYMVALSKRAREDGLLVLEDESNRTTDKFLSTALSLAVDHEEHPDMARLLETEMRTARDREFKAVHVFETMGNYSPAMGLIGTLIGLIRMLGALQDPTTVGPAMAIALVTTFYGAFFANILLLPLAGKLKNRGDEEAIVKAITVEGILAIIKGENPVIIEQRLYSFIPTREQGV